MLNRLRIRPSPCAKGWPKSLTIYVWGKWTHLWLLCLELFAGLFLARPPILLILHDNLIQIRLARKIVGELIIWIDFLFSPWHTLLFLAWPTVDLLLRLVRELFCSMSLYELITYSLNPILWVLRDLRIAIYAICLNWKRKLRILDPLVPVRSCASKLQLWRISFQLGFGWWRDAWIWLRVIVWVHHCIVCLFVAHEFRERHRHLCWQTVAPYPVRRTHWGWGHPVGFLLWSKHFRRSPKLYLCLVFCKHFNIINRFERRMGGIVNRDTLWMHLATRYTSVLRHSIQVQ